MTKIAVIADIHGNLEALKEVLKDIKLKGIKEIYCLGDIIGKGYHSKECIDLVLENCSVLLKGNLEEYITKENPNFNGEMRDFYINQLGKDYIKKINNLSFSHELYISGSLVRFFHASPTSLFKKTEYFDSYKDKINAFYPSDKTMSNEIADIVIYADLHKQFMDRFYNRTLINIGSVGNAIEIIRDDLKDASSMEVTKAFYLIIEGELNSKEYSNNLSFNFIRVPYDIEKELENSKGLKELDKFKIELREAKPRNINELKEKFDI